MLTFPSAPNHVHTRYKASASKQKSTFFFRRQNSTKWLSSNLNPHFWCVTSLTSLGHILYLGFLLWHLWMMREHLRPCLHLTNPCTEPKGSQPNKRPKARYIKRNPSAIILHLNSKLEGIELATQSIKRQLASGTSGPSLMVVWLWPYALQDAISINKC